MRDRNETLAKWREGLISNGEALQQLCAHNVELLDMQQEVLGALLDAETAAADARNTGTPSPLHARDVRWVVLNDGDLAVRIGSQFFSLYKGESLLRTADSGDSTAPTHYRPVGKREFGESCRSPEYLETLEDAEEDAPPDQLADATLHKAQASFLEHSTGYSGAGWQPLTAAPNPALPPAVDAMVRNFDAAYAAAVRSSEPQAWLDAALLGQQLRNATLAAFGISYRPSAAPLEPPASKPRKAGFDNVRFGSATQWWMLLKRLGQLSPTAENYMRDGQHVGYSWKFDNGLTIVAQGDPFTGNYAPKGWASGGFAGHIGLEGPNDAVSAAIDRVFEYAESIKGHDPIARSYI